MSSRGVISASFSPQTGNRVVMISNDGALRLFDTTDENLNKCFGLKMEPYVTIFLELKLNIPTKAEWHPRFDNIFFVGSYQTHKIQGPGNSCSNFEWQIEVYTDNGDKFPVESDNLRSVCSIVKCHPTEDIIVGADTYGGVHVFKE